MTLILDLLGIVVVVVDVVGISRDALGFAVKYGIKPRKMKNY